MWKFKIHPFMRDNKDPLDYKPVVIRKNCDIPGCPHVGDYKAPKSREEIKSYYWFCLDHVREYNQNWDFFKGMNRVEIEHHMYKTALWDRPTWKSTLAGLSEQRTREKIYAHFKSGNVFGDFNAQGESEEDSEPRQQAHINLGSIPHPTLEALATMDLEPPVQWDQIRARYKALAKKYHPDANRDDKDAEELFKKVNIAYNILKISYQQFTALD